MKKIFFISHQNLFSLDISHGINWKENLWIFELIKKFSISFLINKNMFKSFMFQSCSDVIYWKSKRAGVINQSNVTTYHKTLKTSIRYARLSYKNFKKRDKDIFILMSKIYTFSNTFYLISLSSRIFKNLRVSDKR